MPMLGWWKYMSGNWTRLAGRAWWRGTMYEFPESCVAGIDVGEMAGWYVGDWGAHAVSSDLDLTDTFHLPGR